MPPGTRMREKKQKMGHLARDTPSKYNLSQIILVELAIHNFQINSQCISLTSMTILPSFSPLASTSKKTLLLPDMVAEDENDSSGLKKRLFEAGKSTEGEARELQEEETRRCRSRRRMLPDCQGRRTAGTKSNGEFPAENFQL